MTNNSLHNKSDSLTTEPHRSFGVWR